MALRYTKMMILALLLAVALLNHSAFAARKYARRDDLDNIKPIAESGWTVPLVSGTSSLPGPGHRTLTTLAVGRGTVTYSCSSPSRRFVPDATFVPDSKFVPNDTNANVSVDFVPDTRSAIFVPNLVSAEADLYDAAPLVQYMQTVDELNAFTEAFSDYDYGNIDNSTLSYIGHMNGSNGQYQYNVTLSGFQSNFPVVVDNTISAPSAGINYNWTSGHVADGALQIYMVETAGGAAPNNCDGQSPTISLPFAAEFWFYD